MRTPIASLLLLFTLVPTSAVQAREAFFTVEGGFGYAPRVEGGPDTTGRMLAIRAAGFYHGNSGFGAEYGISFPRFWIDVPEASPSNPRTGDESSTTIQGLNLYGGPSLWLHDRVELGVPLQAGVGLVSEADTTAGCYLSAGGQIRTFFALMDLMPFTLSLAAEYAFVLTPGDNDVNDFRMLSIFATLGIWIPTQ